MDSIKLLIEQALEQKTDWQARFYENNSADIFPSTGEWGVKAVCHEGNRVTYSAPLNLRATLVSSLLQDHGLSNFLNTIPPNLEWNIVNGRWTVSRSSTVSKPEHVIEDVLAVVAELNRLKEAARAAMRIVCEQLGI
jgi:hypothetical protein